MPVKIPATIVRLTVACFVLCSCAAPTITPPAAFVRADGTALTGERIDADVARLMQAGRVPGLGLVLIDKGRIAYMKAYGFADKEAARALLPDTVMYGASLTKAAFAYLVMMLVDKGRVDLDRPVADYLPRPLSDYEPYRDLKGDPRWKAWTARMLLSHQAGLPNWRWIEPDKKLRILFAPGSRDAYSGEGIQALQFVLEQGLAVDVGALMQTRVFDRFAMARTSMTWREDFRPNFAQGYDEKGEKLGHNMRKSVRAAGSMDTTLVDFAQFLAGVSRGEGLSPEVRSEMVKPQIAITAEHQFPTQFPFDTDVNRAIGLSYGLGWGLFESKFGRAFFKEGHDDGTDNYALCLDEAGKCILLLSNSSNGEGIFLYLVDALLGEVGLPWEWEGFKPYDKAN